MNRKLLKSGAFVLAFTGLLLGKFNQAHAQTFGQFASGVFMRVSGSNVAYNTSGTGANAIGSQDMPTDLGTFEFHTGTLILNGAEMKTYKGNYSNVCGVTYYYWVNPASNDCPSSLCAVASGQFDLPFKADCGGSIFTDGYGPCGGNDQKWSTQANFIHLSDLSPGDYVLHMSYKLSGSVRSRSACDEFSSYGTGLSGPNNLPLCVSTFHIVPRPLSGASNKNNNALAGGVNEIAAFQNASIRTYPSPVNNIVTIDAENFDNGAVQMQVTNIQGGTSKSISAIYTKGQSITLDMSSYAAGMYFVKLGQGTKTATAKIVKQ